MTLTRFAILSISSLLLFGSCKKEQPVTPENQTPYQDSLYVTASSYDLPFNLFGKTILSAQDEFGGDLTALTTFYVNGTPIDGRVFTPQATGTYLIKAVYKDIVSPEREIRVTTPLKKKILLEYFTSKYCGFCPAAGYRADSLDISSDYIIDYAIHSQDELSMTNALDYYAYHGIDGRPVVLVNRTATRNIPAWVGIQELTDSIDLFMSRQPEAGLAIESSLSGEQLNINVNAKTYRGIEGDLYLTVAIVEDSVISNNQLNYFSGWETYSNTPFYTQPDPIPVYTNHNVLRAILTPLEGQKIESIPASGTTGTIGQFQFSTTDVQDFSKAHIIAFLHSQRGAERISTVINSQIVKAGESVSYEE